MLRHFQIAVPFVAGVLSSPPLFAQEFPDPATDLKMRLAEMAAPFLAEEDPEASMAEFAATAVCIVEALDALPDGIRFEMLQAPDFEDALDLAVNHAERVGLPLENHLEACF